MTKTVTLKKKISSEYSGVRLDVAIAKIYPEFSRNHIKVWIVEGSLQVDGKASKPKKLLQGGELIEINAEEVPDLINKPENIDLSIIYEDESVIVINKAPGIVVHPGAGNNTGTLLNALLHHNNDLGYLPRAGIVHRLDKDTSGIMVVAKTEVAYLDLVKQLKSRTVKREYWTLVVASPLSGGIIDQPIGRHPKNRLKQAVVSSGKEAVTEYEVIKNLRGYSLLKVFLHTGRTHQIRVHFSHMNMPIVGDQVYGGSRRFALGTSPEQKSVIESFRRQALHAKSLSFIHPQQGQEVVFKTELPKDFKKLSDLLLNE